MTDFLTQLKSLKLPSWMDAGEPAKLLRACVRFWSTVYDWITWPLRQFDPLTCAEPLLNLIAWERDITRFDGEPLELYRKRVNFAFINAQQAGEVAGFIAIFSRLGIGYVELLERQEGLDWDVIVVRVTDSQVANNSDLLLEIIRKYGRTCRRYQFEVITTLTVHINIGWYQGEYICYPATLGDVDTTSSATFSASL
ncbi:phage tail protein [Rahnella sp. ChDrAdgB13]|uniref:phage tail protein n=1 Tax=Rahnella sp. ChDrAdgB13 TaxID=1850581 RepID=UPI001AD8646A|nr:phage tail protein [Rahnella sp. ChDrAdgB13]